MARETGILDAFRQWVRPRWQRVVRPAWFGTLRRTRPLGTFWGYDRGVPIDRFYIERFLATNSGAICGRVLEVQSATYTERFGQNVARSDVVDIDPANPRATFITDLAQAEAIPSAIFDCFILTQTLQLIYDVPACLNHVHRILRPGGVALVTVPCLSKVVDEYGPAVGDYWRFTPDSCRRLFGDVFGDAQVLVQPEGNVLAGIGYLSGLAYQELSLAELNDRDPIHPLIVTVSARKAT